MRDLNIVSQENSRIIAFSISPLGDFCRNINRVLLEVGEGELNKVAKIFEDFTLMHQKLDKLKNTKFAQEYPEYSGMLLDIGKSLSFKNVYHVCTDDKRCLDLMLIKLIYMNLA